MINFTEFAIGFGLATGFILLARLSKSYSREKIIYGVGLIIAALIYVGFGFFSDSISWKLIELAGVPVYAIFAWFGVKKSGWFLAVGWVLHTAWDALLHDYSTVFVPHWYIGFCIGFDLLLGGYIGFREWRSR